MYAYIKGTIAGRNEAELIVDNNGVGYLINCPLSISAPLGGIGDEVKVFVYQSVKEDDISLYGFAAQEQKDMFLKLITVSGIGPKVAHSICACLEPEQFAAAVMSNNVAVLTGVKGLGKKTAERIILELKDKLKAQTGKSAGTTKLAVSAGAVSAADGSVMSDAVGALLMLGFKEQEAAESVASAYTEGIGLEELIKKALKLASGSKLA
ncbi:MAG: Holliday junction branch migration protein RuvA [Saccharofermentans sp.]|nr:Holliday junction branch migration protein RuvA [Saccharofermentans sp.]